MAGGLFLSTITRQRRRGVTAAISILVAAILIGRAWRAAHCNEGGLAPEEHLLIFLLMTGMFETGGFSFGMNLSAWRLLVWIVLVGWVLFSSRPTLPRLMVTDLPIVCYGLFLLWCLYRLTAAPSLGYGGRQFLKLLYPFMVLLLARKAARPGRLGVYLMPMIGASLLISLFTSGITEREMPRLVYHPIVLGVFWPRATFADHAAIVVGVILIVLWVYRDCMPIVGRRLYEVGLIWLILSPLAVANRTGLLATAAAISGYFLVRYRARALPRIGGLILLGAAAITFVPEVRQNTFYTTHGVTLNGILHGNVDMANINSTGRFDMWDDLLGRFFRPEPLIGSGLGAIQNHMYTTSYLYGGLQVPHSDYVAMLGDTGLVGLFLYVLAVVAALGLAGLCALRPTTMECWGAAALVFSSFLACLSATAFDNVFNYSLPVHSLPFAFTGILLGLISNSPSEAIPDPWRWSREYIWSRLIPLRWGRYQTRQTPSQWTNSRTHPWRSRL
jgi:hypothetical protein